MSDEDEESTPDVVEFTEPSSEQTVVFLCHYLPSNSSDQHWFWDAVDFLENSKDPLPAATITQPVAPMIQEDSTIDVEEQQEPIQSQDAENSELMEGKSKHFLISTDLRI